MASKCPGGHFCFWELFQIRYTWYPFVKSRNALAGIFVFGSKLIDRFSLILKNHSSKCPGGHFCFWEGVMNISQIFSEFGRNALAGIFVFGRHLRYGSLPDQYGRSKCPGGHFCFWEFSRSLALTGACFTGRNALAGIFVFGREVCRRLFATCIELSKCPGGHFCFWELSSWTLPQAALSHKHVEMPWRAFLFLGASTEQGSLTYRNLESKCPGGHFCFWEWYG